MGFFTSAEDTYNDIYIENAHRYESEYGINLITLEAVQFGQELFGDMVRCDIQEQVALAEGTEVMHEGIVNTIYTKIKTFLQKIWNKIKLFFKGLYAKVLARITSDNKKFYDKYHKAVDENRDALTMEVKYRPVEIVQIPVGKVKAAIEAASALDGDSDNDAIIGAMTAVLLPDKKELHNASDYKQELKDLMIKEEEEEKFSSIKSKIEELLKGGNKAVKDAQKVEQDALKVVKDMDKYYKTLTDEQKDYDKSKKVSITSDKDGNATVVADKSALGTMRTLSPMTTLITTHCSAVVDAIKFENSQARKIYARAVSYRESYDYEQGMAFTEADSL